MTQEEFDAAVMVSGNVDMIGDSRMEYDGPRCADPDCDSPVDDDGQRCGNCLAADAFAFGLDSMTVRARDYGLQDGVLL